MTNVASATYRDQRKQSDPSSTRLLPGPATDDFTFSHDILVTVMGDNACLGDPDDGLDARHDRFHPGQPTPKMRGASSSIWVMVSFRPRHLPGVEVTIVLRVASTFHVDQQRVDLGHHERRRSTRRPSTFGCGRARVVTDRRLLSRPWLRF